MWNGRIWKLPEKDYNIPKLAISTAVLDTLAAVLASFVIMPAVFAFGLDVNAGPPLLFMTMPIIFDKMPGGTIIAIVFFLSLFFAAISSSINMLEGVVEAIISNTKLTRKSGHSCRCSDICTVDSIKLKYDNI